MATRKDAHEARNADLQSFGKDLARRAKGHCELCEKGEGTLRIHEVSPAPKEPDFDRCLLLCDECRQWVVAPEKCKDSESLRFLSAQSWSEIPMVQILAVRLLRHLAKEQDWARSALNELYLDDEIERLIAEAE